MGQIRIITDTASDITRQRAEELDVIVVPISIKFGETEMPMESEEDFHRFFRRLAEEKEKHKQAAIFPVESLRKINDELKRYTPAERRKLFRLKPDRAEVIVPAAEIFLEVARCGQSKEIWVPMIGLADGIIDSLYAKRLKAKR